MTDEQFELCIKRMAQGDKEGLKDIYEAYLSYIYSIVLRVLYAKENAEDITSEFFIKLWRIAGQYQFGGNHRAWMATIARNMALDFLRKHKRETLVDEIAETDYEIDDNTANNAILRIDLKKALMKLSIKEREIIHLKIAGEHTFKEIAKIMQMPMGTVTWSYQNAIKKLRKCGYE